MVGCQTAPGFAGTDRMRSGASIPMYSSGSGRRTVCVGRAYISLKRSRAVSLQQSACVSGSTAIDGHIVTVSRTVSQ